MKRPEKQKQSSKRMSKIISTLFLFIAILFFVLMVAGFASGGVGVGIFCLLFGLICLYVRRLLKNNAAKSDHDPAPAPDPVPDLEKRIKDVGAEFENVEVEYPDGHSEQIKIYKKITCGCLVTDGGRAYHSKVACFKNWSTEYRDSFTKWHLITLEEAENRGLRRCGFCYAYELAKEYRDAVVHTLSCSAKKYQDQLRWCRVGEECSVEYDSDNDRYTVLDFCNEEIGYLPASVADKHKRDIEYCKIFLDEITEQENGKYKVKVIIS